MNYDKLKYKSISFLLLTFSVITLLSQSSCQNAKYKEKSLDEKVDSLVSIMTLDEKIGQMSMVRHFDVASDTEIKSKLIGAVIHTQGPLPGKTAKDWQNRFKELQQQALKTRLGIPLIFGVDAVHGQNTFNGATIFPHNIGMGATHDESLVKKAAEITAIEMKATGFNWTFSPCIAIPYNEKWGRTYEAFSEDTQLTSKLARASVLGYQGEETDKINVLATAKHFIADGATENGEEGGISSLSFEEIRQRLLPPYEAAIEAGVGAIMVSFNSALGENMHANKYLITDILKNELKFDGIIVTDWRGYSRFGENNIIKAGVDMVMAVEGDLNAFQSGLKNGVKNGSISIERVNDAVHRILKYKFKTGLFSNPFPDSTYVNKIGIAEHRNVARQAVRESLVLLKNDNKALPLEKNLGEIVVIGEHADNSGLQSGGWTVNWQGTNSNYSGATTILDGLKNQYKGNLIYDKYGVGNYPEADATIIVVGEKPYAEFIGDIGDGSGNFKLTLKKKYTDYIKKYRKQSKKLVVILISGRPMLITDELELSDAFIAAWLPGSEGEGISDVLFGDYNFSGTLPHTWPSSMENFKGIYGPNYWDDSIKPLFKINYGLKY